MKIRSITFFFEPGKRNELSKISSLGTLSQEAANRYRTRGFEVQTIRLATTPFPEFLPLEDFDQAVEKVSTLEAHAGQNGFSYLSLGPAMIESPESYPFVIKILSNTKNVFVSGMMVNRKTGVCMPAVRACAEIIHQAATLEPEGFANLRFAGLAGVRERGPFFPSAYQKGKRPGFGLAIECADIALMTFSRAISLEMARKSLLKTLQDYGRVLSGIGEELAAEFDVDYYGIDYSLAPFPQAWCSLGSALERLGPTRLGQCGSLAAAAYIADTLDRGNWKRTGFNGLMLPVLEDSTLAQRASEGILTIKDLLLFSAVCGIGLDIIPLPGNTSVEQLYAVLLDIATLSNRLDKPLTARLLPIPSKSAGELTAFQFSYFANSRIMEITAGTLDGRLNGQESYQLEPRKRTR